MKERPILFSGEMVRALLDGRKTMTRRVVKPQPSKNCDAVRQDPDGRFFFRGGGIATCPYGQPGDRLYVKERIERGYCGDMSMSRYFADGYPTVADAWPWQRNTLTSIHCPRGLSRILLEITNVLVERLQEINDDDARAEGLLYEPAVVGGTFMLWSGGPGLDQSNSPKLAYGKLWDSINAARGFGWNVNPWVWVVSFRVLDTAVRAA